MDATVAAQSTTTTTSTPPSAAPSASALPAQQQPRQPTAGIDMSVGAAVAPLALEMKPKSAEMLQTQKIKKLVRRNASDKLKLIQMVHDNPILWDSRLPNFKGAEEEKNRAWEQIGKEFNAPGRRVARAFKSLRESYRRELAHVKLMGNGFKPKWGLYEAMDFLRDVIRERKGGSHAVEQTTMGINLSAFSQHLNNNNKAGLKLNSLHHSSFNDSAVLNLSKYSSLNMPTTDDYFYFVKPELGLGNHMNGVGQQQPLPAHQPHSNGQNDSRVSSTRNDNTQNTTFDDIDASSLRSGDEASLRNEPYSHEGSDEVEELEAIDADFPYPLILDSNSPMSGVGGGGSGLGGGGGSIGSCGGGGINIGVGPSVNAALKRKRKDMHTMVSDDVDEYEGQMLQQHRHLRQQNVGGMSLAGGGGVGGSNMDISPAQTVREVLNSKFCGFISAKLNSMEDTEADNLMNKILMLLVQTQGNEAK